MAERSRLRELIDAFVLSGRGKVEIDALLTDLERSAKAMGAYEAGRDHAPAIAQLVEAKVRLEKWQRDVQDAIPRALGSISAAEGHFGEAMVRKLATARRCISDGLVDLRAAQTRLRETMRHPIPDTPETVAEKAKMARAVADRFNTLVRGRKP